MKSECVSNDSSVNSAKVDLAAAQSAVDQLHTRFISGLSTNSNWNDANSIVEQKKALWVEAKSKLDAANELLSQDESDKRQEYNAEMAQWNAEHSQPDQAQGYGQVHNK